MKNAFFFDRDGVLNEEVGYLHEIEKFKWIDGAIDAIKFCNDQNFLTVVVTNQSGVARGFYSEDDVKKIHAFMQNELEKFDAHIDAFYYCPHHPEGNVTAYRKICDCRKPEPGLILRACRELDINPAILNQDAAQVSAGWYFLKAAICLALLDRLFSRDKKFCLTKIPIRNIMCAVSQRDWQQAEVAQW